MFPLFRYFSIASLIGILTLAVALTLFHRALAFEKLTEIQTRANVTLTRTFQNALWPRYADFLAEHGGARHGELAAHPRTAALQSEVGGLIAGLNVVKIKIYGGDGNTVFSTDPAQLGEDRSDNPGFQSALRGAMVSALTFRDQFYAYEGVVANRNLLTTYIPIRRDATAPVEGVFELYSDVTELVADIEATQRTVFLSTALSLCLLYLFLSLIVRRADQIIRRYAAERRKQEALIQFQAYFDELTGLPNRNSFADTIANAIKHAERGGEQFALLYVDIDRFKIVNDSLGHAAGDLLLKTIGQRLTLSIRASDQAFRLGGDEFVVLLGAMEGEADAFRIAERIQSAMAAPVTLGNHEVVARISIGIASFPKDGATIEQLTHCSDTAMYEVKRSGGNGYRFYSKDMNIKAGGRLRREAELQRAADKGEFRLYYQPKIHLGSGQVVGIEALLRWQRDTGEILPPEEFVPLLEETGMIVAVGEWVLNTACAQNRVWQDAGLPRLTVSVNISPRQFSGARIVQHVRTALGKSGLAARYLELELTETLLLSNAATALETMNTLKRLGVKLSIDDFGSGYSSMAYLKKFPVDYLKIDRSFIRQLHDDDRDAAITSAITSLAQSLNLGLVAEGVETPEQLEHLRRIGCPEVQGFFFSEPVPADDLAAYLRKSAGDCSSKRASA